MFAVRMLAGVGAALVAALMAVAPPAHADYDSFYKYLEDHGTMRFEFPGGLFSNAAQMCQMLRGGASPDDIRRMSFGAMDVAGVLDAAQHEICPDTLR